MSHARLKVLTHSCHVVLAAVGLVGLWLCGGPPGSCLSLRLVSCYGEGHYLQRKEPANALRVFWEDHWLLFQHHVRMPLWPHPDLCKLKINIHPSAVWMATWIAAVKDAFRVNVLLFCCWPGDNNHSVGASHLDVHSGNGVCLPLLCCMYFIPLPVSVQDEANPG